MNAHQKRLPPLNKQDKTYDIQRQAGIINISMALEQREEFMKYPVSKCEGIVRELEKACYNNSINRYQSTGRKPKWSDNKFEDFYMRCIWKIAYHTKNKNNKTIIDSIMNTEDNFSKFAMMSDSQLDPEQYAPIIKDINRSRNIVVSQKTTSMYFCQKCKQKKCKVENIYNRGLDEGVNLKITCVECSHHWFG